ncbi:ATP-binding protein [Vibrio tarriae]|uniref:ATP/GTP-binding protein n=1 Tax=Vibrio tarriae TaxID=2014742 RepID=UPI000DE2F8D8|nr:ATP-binding protein [Vibrio tarriae]RBM67848.1 ATP-binding protein [Vibrio tarriae]
MKIAISGTYSTGKTTLTEALSIATQVPRTQARTMREILPDAVPRKTLEQCNPAELLNLGLSRLSERVVNEERCGDKFFSDGSCLHEWVYGAARLETGINPNDSDLVLAIKRLMGKPYLSVHRDYIDAFGNVAKRHAKKTYTKFVHLPIEFDLVADGHRPVSERFRQLSNDLLLSTVKELNIPYITVGGDLRNRLITIAEHFNLPIYVDVDEAIEMAVKKVKTEAIAIENYRLSILSPQKA